MTPDEMEITSKFAKELQKFLCKFEEENNVTITIYNADTSIIPRKEDKIKWT